MKKIVIISIDNYLKIMLPMLADIFDGGLVKTIQYQKI